jgi:ArsR family transcriptional regulator
MFSLSRSPDHVRSPDLALRDTLIYIDLGRYMSLSDKQLVLALKATANPARLKILRLLKQKGQCSIGKGVGMCACDVQDHITLSQPTISHHMAVLRKAGLVVAEKHGLWMWYRRNEKALKELAQTVSADL